ncbi:hypothetical protein KZ829_27480 [Actinoplanes hulinensis]|uniref:Uncharacterized protein n=1 Tax=Actinoplanes hulinensis TaxID=1144547 RepID=A0ABS7B953_9ACTN|nr:hypothetical protein [Actinoplanes hulinensis]MBW6437480.1 hypothetical protein [Actinoplanes hulinensis]
MTGDYATGDQAEDQGAVDEAQAPETNGTVVRLWSIRPTGHVKHTRLSPRPQQGCGGTRTVEKPSTRGLSAAAMSNV